MVNDADIAIRWHNNRNNLLVWGEEEGGAVGIKRLIAF